MKSLIDLCTKTHAALLEGWFGLTRISMVGMLINHVIAARLRAPLIVRTI